MMEILPMLRDRGIRVTGARRRLLQIIPPDSPFRAEDLWRHVRQVYPDVGRATFFRTLSLLLELGLLERLEERDGTRRYRLCTRCGGEHHHHLVCSQCGQDAVVRGDALMELEAALGRTLAAQGFVATGHQVQLFGRCPKCQ